MLAIALCIVEIVIALGPLRKAVREQEESGMMMVFDEGRNDNGNDVPEYQALPNDAEVVAI